MYDATHMAVDDSGDEVRPGQPIKSFRGDRAAFLGITRIPEGGKSGKVLTEVGEFYSQVFGLRIIEREGAGAVG